MSDARLRELRARSLEGDQGALVLWILGALDAGQLAAQLDSQAVELRVLLRPTGRTCRRWPLPDGARPEDRDDEGRMRVCPRQRSGARWCPHDDHSWWSLLWLADTCPELHVDKLRHVDGVEAMPSLRCPLCGGSGSLASGEWSLHSYSANGHRLPAAPLVFVDDAALSEWLRPRLVNARWPAQAAAESRRVDALYLRADRKREAKRLEGKIKRRLDKRAKMLPCRAWVVLGAEVAELRDQLRAVRALLAEEA